MRAREGQKWKVRWWERECEVRIGFKAHIPLVSWSFVAFDSCGVASAINSRIIIIILLLYNSFFLALAKTSTWYEYDDALLVLFYYQKTNNRSCYPLFPFLFGPIHIITYTLYYFAYLLLLNLHFFNNFIHY